MRTLQGLIWLFGAVPSSGCDTSSLRSDSGPAVSGGVHQASLDPEAASKVLARIGQNAITLGDYATALERMDPMERLRYQSTERRKLLLEQMVDVQLLAGEARRRGLDQLPETQMRLTQLLGEELRRELRARLPKPKDLPDSEVQSYYDAHREEFSEPEKRRASLLAVADAAFARQLLGELRSNPTHWGRLVRAHSLIQPVVLGGDGNNAARPPLELEGDVGLVSAPGQTKGVNPDVPEPVRAALFTLNEHGQIYDQPIEHQGKYYLVRRVGRSEARTRTRQEVDAVIRLRLLEARLIDAEVELQKELRQKYPVVINQAALQRLDVSGAEARPTASATVSTSVPLEAPATTVAPAPGTTPP